MKRMILLTLLLSLNAHAADQKQTMSGTGIDGKACSVEITRNGDALKNVVLRGATEVFEIISDNGSDGMGPKTQINSRGAEELFPIVEDRNIFEMFTHSNSIFSDSETFEFDTSDAPNPAELKGLKMVGAIQLNYDDGQLAEVKAATKFKGLAIVTLASSKFICK